MTKLKYNKIALTGLPGVGKDTIATEIEDYFYSGRIFNGYCKGYNCKRYSFAQNIKQAALLFTGNTQTYHEGFNGPSQYRNTIISNFSTNNNVTYRDLLNTLGELGRSYHPDIWVNKIIKEINNDFVIYNNLNLAIVTDMRRINEYVRLEQERFCLVKIKNPNLQHNLSNLVNTHELESFADSKFHYIFNNNSSLDDLYSKIEEFATFLTF